MVQANLKTSRNLSILSGKGGTGKTHIAVNLAIQLARMGHRVLLIDTDLGSANTAFRINVHPSLSLADFYDGNCELGLCVMSSGLGFDLVTGRPGHSAMANIGESQVIDLLKSFERLSTSGRWDDIIFDLGAGISNRTIDFSIVSDEIIIVVVPNEIIHGYAVLKACWQRFCDVQSIDYLRQRADITKTPYFLRENYDSPFGVPRVNYIVNKADNPDEGNKIYLRITKVAREFFYTKDGYWKLPVRYLGSLPDSYEFIKQTERQKLPAVVMNPYHPFCKSLNGVAQLLCAQRYMPAGKIKVSLTDRIKGLISMWSHR